MIAWERTSTFNVILVTAIKIHSNAIIVALITSVILETFVITESVLRMKTTTLFATLRLIAKLHNFAYYL